MLVYRMFGKVMQSVHQEVNIRVDATVCRPGLWIVARLHHCIELVAVSTLQMLSPVVALDRFSFFCCLQLTDQVTGNSPVVLDGAVLPKVDPLPDPEQHSSAINTQ